MTERRHCLFKNFVLWTEFPKHHTSILKRSYVKFWLGGEQVDCKDLTEEKEKLPISIYILRAIVKWQKWTLSKYPWNSWYWSLKRSQVLVWIPISTYTCIIDCLNVIEKILFQSFQAYTPYIFGNNFQNTSCWLLTQFVSVWSVLLLIFFLCV